MTDPKIARMMTDAKLAEYAQIHRDELAVLTAEIKRRKNERLEREQERNPLQLGDLVWTAWELRNGLEGKVVVGVNPKSVLVGLRFRSRVPLGRILKAERGLTGESVDLSGVK